MKIDLCRYLGHSIFEAGGHLVCDRCGRDAYYDYECFEDGFYHPIYHFSQFILRAIYWFKFCWKRKAFYAVKHGHYVLFCKYMDEKIRYWGNNYDDLPF